MPNDRPRRPTVCELIIIEMANQHGIDIGDRIDVVRDAIIHIQDEMNRENENENEDEDDAQLLVRERRILTVTERLLAQIRQLRQGRGGRPSKKRPTARRLRSSKARKSHKARATRRR